MILSDLHRRGGNMNDPRRPSEEQRKAGNPSAGGVLDRRSLLVRAAGTVGALALGGVATGCASSTNGGGSGNGSKQMAFAQPDTSFAGYPLLLKGVKDRASSRGFTVLQSHANSKLDAQVSEI